MDFSINAVTRRQWFRGTLALFATCTMGRAVFAADRQALEARELVSRLVEHILQVIGSDQRAAAREQRLMAAIESQTDLSLLARMTMGRYWRQASVRQRRSFVDVFRRYLLRSFASRLRRYAGADLGAAHDRVAIIGTKRVGKGDIVVQSQINPPSGAPLDVDWRLRPRSDRLYVIDLVVEGVSLLISQRSEFGSVLERIGIDGLIGELEERLARQA